MLIRIFKAKTCSTVGRPGLFHSIIQCIIVYSQAFRLRKNYSGVDDAESQIKNLEEQFDKRRYNKEMITPVLQEARILDSANGINVLLSFVTVKMCSFNSFKILLTKFGWHKAFYIKLTSA